MTSPSLGSRLARILSLLLRKTRLGRENGQNTKRYKMGVRGRNVVTKMEIQTQGRGRCRLDSWRYNRVVGGRADVADEMRGRSSHERRRAKFGANLD